MGQPEPPEDQVPAAEEEVDEAVDLPQEGTDGGGGGEKPEGHWGG